MANDRRSDRRTRRSVLRGIGIAASTGAVGVAGIGRVTPASVRSTQDTDGEFTTERVEIESFDDTTIVATLYVPATDEPHPSILMTHGWGSNREANDPLASGYAANGYVVLSYDSRGFGESGGTVTSTGPNERDDARELITWLADHDAVRTDAEGDPRIGMDGGSYGGGIQLRTAAVDDRLDAIVPRITWHNLARSLAPNGVLKWGWYSALQRAGDVSGRIDPSLAEMTESIVENREMGETGREFYRARSPVSYLEDVSTPTLLVHEWYDRLFPVNQALANYRGLREAGVETRLLLADGASHHFDPPERTETEEAFVADAALSWLDAHLKGDGEHGLASITYYEESSDSFVEADAFPPADASTRCLGLSIDESARLGNQRSGCARGEEVLRFDFQVDERTELVGVPTLRATVTPTGRGTTRLAIALQRVADGEVTTIKDQVTPVAVDDRRRLDLDLNAVQQAFEPGDTLRLAIATRDQPLSDVPLPTSDTGLYVDSDESAGAVVHDSAADPARLLVPMRPA